MYERVLVHDEDARRVWHLRRPTLFPVPGMRRAREHAGGGT